VELVEAQWDNTDTLIVKLDQTNHPYVKAANYINAYKKDGYLEINGNKSTEAYFFINSVTDIASILEYCQLGNDEVKIVCADNPSNRDKLAGYTISNSRSTNKPFTFITNHLKVLIISVKQVCASWLVIPAILIPCSIYPLTFTR